jgi:hypothetical protein
MSNLNYAPIPVQNWLSQLPSENIGTLYATIRHPIGKWLKWIPPIFIEREYKVPVWGQVCDGRDHKCSVENMLHNEFPNRGKGYTYISWRAEPDHPDVNKYPRTGMVADPKPYNGGR